MKKTTRFTALLLSIFMLLTCFIIPSKSEAATTYTVKFYVTYGQSNARSSLSLVNNFRTGKEAWYWNEDNKTKTKLTDLCTLKYDYELEKIAMQRCCEIALSFSHTRPNNTAWSTAYTYNAGYYGENICCATYSITASNAVDLFKETDQDYSGQGHRRNMLNTHYTRYAMAKCTYNGYTFFVQEFGSKASGTSKTSANNSKVKVSTKILSSNIKKFYIKAPTVSYKKKKKIGTTYIKVTDSSMSYCPVSASGAKLSSSNKKIASVTNTYYLKGNKKGKAKLTVTQFGKKATNTITVK